MTPSHHNRDWLRLALAFFGVAGALGVTVWLRRRKQRPQATTAYPSPDTLYQTPKVDASATRTPQNGLELRWQVPADTVTVYGGASPTSINTVMPLAVIADADQITLDDLDPAQRYYFQLQFTGGSHDGETRIVAEREVLFDGTANFRDIGGYRTKDGRYTVWGKVYRGGELNNLTDADLKRLTDMGLQVSCDLRTVEEVEEAPDRLPEGVVYVGLPVHMKERRSKQVRTMLKYRSQMDDFMIDAYTRVGIDNNPTVFGGVMKRIANGENLPLVVHCTAGKDRTGTAIALLLDVLGVPDETILADYALSNAHFEMFQNIGKRAITPFKRFGVTVETVQPFFTANPNVMAATLAHVRANYGSAEQYLITRGGVTPAEIEQVRALMLESPGQPTS